MLRKMALFGFCDHNNHFLPFQLRVPAELHPVGPVGDRLRDPGGQHPADHPPEQEPLPGAPHGIARGIVSISLH